jgi:oligopeptidase B
MKNSYILLITLSIILLFFSHYAQETPSSTTKTASDLPITSLFSPEKYAPPSATIKPKTLTDATGDKREDPYFWLNERENPEVIRFLESENRYYDSVMTPVAGLNQKLFDEMVGRIKQDDNSVPYFKNGYWYYTRFETGKEYPIYCRKKSSLEASEEIILEVNELAKGKSYCSAAGLTVSPDNRILCYIVDYTGRNLYKSVFKDLTTGKILSDSFDSAGGYAWTNDSKSIIYNTKDKVTLRPDKVWRHVLGNTQKDQLLYTETDETANVSISKSKSDQYIFLWHGYTQNVETHFMDANKSDGKFQVIKPREKGFFYTVDHYDDKFLIRTNWDAQNFRLMQTPVSQPSQANWKDLLPHRPNVYFEGMEVFKDYLVTLEREGGLKRFQIRRWSDQQTHTLQIDEPTYNLDTDENPEFNTKILRYAFSTLKTPNSIIDYDLESRQKTVKKVQPVLGGFDTKNYSTEFIWATARDGVKVPVSMVYKNGLKRDGKAPCYQIGYGSYGSSYDPSFNSSIISLLDRGFIVAIAHIRGGMEMGYQWYENGKMLNKMNTFNDFIDCSEMLCKEKYTSADRLFASGRSAGGLLMGAVTNLRPDLYKGIIAGVPFMDVLTTMGDASIPLTTGEYTEWGNPAIKAEYDYMAKYSPYDNLKAQNYPNLFVITSLADSQVQYFEPAKYVAKLRTLKTDKNMLIFSTNMSGSHGGASGRFERLRERSREFAWMMGLMGMKDEKLKN